MRRLGIPFSASLVLFLAGSAAWAQREYPATSGLPSVSMPAFPEEATRVHVVLLADTLSGDIGAPCGKDIVAFRGALLAGFRDKTDRLVFHDLTGKYPGTSRDWHPREVFRYLQQLQVGNNDTLVIFHSGHGSIRNRHFPEKTHFLGMNSGMISLGAIYEALRGQQLRALIVLTDTCSSLVGGPALGRAAVEAQLAATVNSASVLNLFLRVIGEISITAAEDGTTAKASFRGPNPGGAGSAFTVALLCLLYDGNKTFRSWGELFPYLQEETYLASGNGHRARAFVIREHAIAQGHIATRTAQQSSLKPDASGNTILLNSKVMVSGKPLARFPRGPSRRAE